MARERIDTQGIGLDAGLAFTRWLTGAENLHYGLWTGLDLAAANLRAAQEAYTEALFALLPEGADLRILDIGGGAGETARKLLALGHRVEIVVPSPYLAGRARANAPGAVLHQCRFEEFAGRGPFDVCLFSESFQYIPLDLALDRAAGLLAPGGRIVIGDCFRAEGFVAPPVDAVVGGGHPVGAFRAAVAARGLRVLAEHDVTEAAAPSVELEQGFFHVVGHAIGRIDAELARKPPWQHRALNWVLGRLVSGRKRARLEQRLYRNTRTAAVFAENNRYLMTALEPPRG
ncbi:MAG: class I SAM-dependent methyltransferase [Gemmobacter sp.]